MISLLKALYLLCASLLGLYTASQLILVVLFLRYRRVQHPLPAVKNLPVVGIQLPIYNEKYVVDRLLEAVAALDYPVDRLRIQVLDDSTDDSSLIVARKVAQLRRRGINIQHIQREKREGFKAGALQHGLALTDAEFIAIFDADFVPPKDFLQRTIPYFVHNPRLGILQTRWGHLNPDANWLTGAQSLAIDAHFVVEQTARNRADFPMTFNGSGGIWRRTCIDDAGGWSADTLTEDLDLSYRARLKGWKYHYIPDLVVPGEIPPVMTAYKKQQARWAQGVNQCLSRLIVPIWKSDMPLLHKLMATQHLVQYLPHSFMVPLFVLTPILIVYGGLQDLPLGWLGLVSIIPLAMNVLAQFEIGQHPVKRLMYFPVMMVIGTGMMPNNAAAAFRAFRDTWLHRQSEFIRTPKFGNNQSRPHVQAINWLTRVEVIFAVYAFIGTILAWQYQPGLMPYMMLYLIGFTAMVAWDFYDRGQLSPNALMEDEIPVEEQVAQSSLDSEDLEADPELEPEYDTIYS